MPHDCFIGVSAASAPLQGDSFDLASIDFYTEVKEAKEAQKVQEEKEKEKEKTYSLLYNGRNLHKELEQFYADAAEKRMAEKYKDEASNARLLEVLRSVQDMEASLKDYLEELFGRNVKNGRPLAIQINDLSDKVRKK